MSSESSDIILLDAHVHLHRCFDLDDALDAAFENFRTAAGEDFGVDTFTGVLCLTEAPGESGFDRLHAGTSRAGARWRSRRTDEESSLILESAPERKLTVIAGSQIATAEGLEVLAIGTNSVFPAGIPAREALLRARDAGVPAVVPWGFGKWSGRRGRLLAELLEERETAPFALGDNANRLALGNPPFFLRQAASRGEAVISGSDPLPFPSESRRPGSFGIAIGGSLAQESAARDVATVLLSLSGPVKSFGRYERPARFLRNQIAMQIRKRERNRAMPE